MSRESGLNRYRVTATYKGKHLAFTVEADSGHKAQAEARRRAKVLGMNRIFVNQVGPTEKVVIKSTTNHGTPFAALGGERLNTDPGTEVAGGPVTPGMPILSLDEINAKIAAAWDRLVCFAPRPDCPPLKAYELWWAIIS